jgi:hypothetical protein
MSDDLVTPADNPANGRPETPPNIVDEGKRLSIKPDEGGLKNQLDGITNMLQIGKIERLSVFSDAVETDPTEQFLVRSANILPVTPSNIDQLVRDAQLRRILVISCPDEAILESIAQGITQHHQFKSLQKRALYLGSDCGSEDWERRKFGLVLI